MKFFKKLAKCFSPYDSDYLSLILLSTFSSISSCGIIAIGLWIAHAPSVPIASEEAHRSCPEHCEKMCAKSSQK
jgi:hypothetical protein